MANNRIEIIMIRQIIQLKEAGLSNRKISTQLGVHRNSVNTYVSHLKQLDHSFDKLLKLPDKELHVLLDCPEKTIDPRHEILKSLSSHYERELKKVGCTYQTLWYNYRETYPKGYGYTRFKHYLQEWHAKQEVSMHINHKMGDKIFVDFCGKHLSYINQSSGEVIDTEVFVAVLGGSQYTFVTAVESQKSEDFIIALNDCLQFFGGASQALVCDNLKAAVTKSSKYEPLLNKNMSAFGLFYNTVILPTRAYKPQDKSLVEGAVKLVYQRIFYPLEGIQFFSLASLNQAIKEKLTLYNEQSFKNRAYSRKTLFETEEKICLKSLPFGVYQMKSYKRAKVQKNGHVWLKEDGHYYSVPYIYIGKQVALHYTKTMVEVYFNHDRIASHARSKIIGGYTTLKDHMPTTHQFVQSWNADFFINWGKEKSDPIGKYFGRVIQKRAYPEQAYKSCIGLQQLYKRYSHEHFEKACQRATEYERFGYLVIKNILENGLEQIFHQEEQLSLKPQQDHKNIRGSDYYKSSS